MKISDMKKPYFQSPTLVTRKDNRMTLTLLPYFVLSCFSGLHSLSGVVL